MIALGRCMLCVCKNVGKGNSINQMQMESRWTMIIMMIKCETQQKCGSISMITRGTYPAACVSKIRTQDPGDKKQKQDKR